MTAAEARAYAVAAAELGSQIPKLKTDKAKRQGIQGAMQLAALGWELAEQAEAQLGKTPDVEQAKDITVAVERECRILSRTLTPPWKKGRHPGPATAGNARELQRVPPGEKGAGRTATGAGAGEGPGLGPVRVVRGRSGGLPRE